LDIDILYSENTAIAYRHLPYVGEIGVIFASKTLAKFPLLRILDCIKRIYPFEYAVTNTEAMYAAGINFELASHNSFI
jgi:hypothetical protein